MALESIMIRSITKGGFTRVQNDGLRHVKKLPCLSIVQATEGCYSLGMDGAPPRRLDEGECFVADASRQQEIIHHVSPDTGCMTARWVFLDVYANAGQRLDTLFSFPPYPRPEVGRVLEELMDELFATEDVFETRILCYRMLQALFPDAAAVKPMRSRTAEAADYMVRRFQEPLTVEQIAAHCCLSPSRLYAVFKEDTGISPIAYLNDYRLSYSCFLLETTDKSIGEIAQECGFSCPFYFSRLFRQHYSLPPSQVRKRRG